MSRRRGQRSVSPAARSIARWGEPHAKVAGLPRGWKLRGRSGSSHDRFRRLRHTRASRRSRASHRPARTSSTSCSACRWASPPSRSRSPRCRSRSASRSRSSASRCFILTLLASRWIAQARAGSCRRWSSTSRSTARSAARPAGRSSARRRSSATARAWTGARLVGAPAADRHAGFTVAVSLWSTALGFVTSPLWYWAMPDDDETIPLLDSTSLGYTAAARPDRPRAAADDVVACRALAAGTGRAARAMLG